MRKLFLILLAVCCLGATATSLDLSWLNQDTQSPAPTFPIERGLDGINWTQIAETASGVTAYTDTGLSPATTYYYKVKARNSVGDSGYSNIASGTTLAAPPPAAVLANINFQPSSAPIPSGYQMDDGSAYTVGRGYGWTVDLSGNTRDRDVNADQRFDTFAFVWNATTNTWQYDLPNGSYLVSLASGDGAYAQGPHQVIVEGTTLINGVSTAVDQYITVTDVPITVADGQLTVVIGHPTGVTMLNYVIIKSDAPGTIPTGLAANVSVTVTTQP